MSSERSSGRVRKATQKVVESQDLYIVQTLEQQTLPKRKLKGIQKAEANKEAKLNKGGDVTNKQPVSLYQVPEPKNMFENKYIPSSVALSLLDKAEQISVSDDQMICTGAEGGFRMIRATHGVHFGPYYWECEILPPLTTPTAPALTPRVRVGWSTRFGELRGPVGYDKHSYGYRDVSGSKIHQRRREDNYGESFGVGDVVGCLIDLGPNENYSEVRFFKNGVDQGQAYGYEIGTLIPKGVYFPAISLFGTARVRVNFGPSFIEPIDNTKFSYNSYCDVQPMNAREIAEHDKNIALIRQKRKDTSLNKDNISKDITRDDVESESTGYIETKNDTVG